jgi:hypothetical protein
MVCQTQIVVEAPAEHVLSIEFHVRSKFTFQTRKSKISFCLFTILAYRTTG